MRFSNTFNLKILEKERLVRISVRTSDERVDEFYLPLLETSSIFHHDIESTLDRIGNDFIWIKRTPDTNKIGIGLRNSLFNWSVFSMDTQHWIVCREEFISKFRKFEKNFKGERRDNSLPLSKNIEFQSLDKEISGKLDVIQSGLSVLSSLSDRLDAFQGMMERQATVTVALVEKLERIDLSLSRMHIENRRIVPTHEELEEISTRMFVPIISESDGEGKLEITTENREINTLLETVNQLKKLREKK